MRTANTTSGGASQQQPPLIDMTDDDQELEVLKMIPGKGAAGGGVMGPYAGLGGGGLMSAGQQRGLMQQGMMPFVGGQSEQNYMSLLQKCEFPY